MKRYLPIRPNILELRFIEIFAFAMMFEPEDVFGVFSYVYIHDFDFDCLIISNYGHHFLICYQ